MKSSKNTYFGVPERHMSSPARSRKRVGIGLAVVLLIAGLGITFHILSGPVEGRPVHTAVPSMAIGKTVQLPAASLPSRIASDYFGLTLPAGYRLQASSAQSSQGLLYQQTLIKPSAFGSLIFAIAIKALPEGGLAADSAYVLRLQQPGRYRFSDQQVQGETVRLAADKESGSTVVFWPHGGYLATIGTTSGISNPAGDNAEIMRALQPLLAAWQWR